MEDAADEDVSPTVVESVGAGEGDAVIDTEKMLSSLLDVPELESEVADSDDELWSVLDESALLATLVAEGVGEAVEVIELLEAARPPDEDDELLSMDALVESVEESLVYSEDEL